MRVNKNYEAELNLKDLLFYILYQWRIILLVGVIAAGIFGFIEYWSFEKYHRNGELTPDEVKYESEAETYRNAIERAELDIAAYQPLIEDSTRYRETSMLMKLDPRNIWTAEKDYYLEVNPAQKQDSGISEDNSEEKIMTVLARAFAEDIDAETLIEYYGTDSRKDIDNLSSIIIDPEANMISVVGSGASKEEAVSRKEFVDSYLITASEKLLKEESFTLSPISDSVGTKTALITSDKSGKREERNLAKIQSEINDNIRVYQNQQNAYINNRDALLTRVLAKPKPQTLKQIILGFVLGFFLAVVALAFFYLLNGRLKTGREMNKRYELPLLGEFDHSRAWWKGKGIDRLLEHFEFGRETQPEKEFEQITALITDEKAGQTLLLTGTIEEKKMRKLYDGLAPRLEEKGIRLTLEPEYLLNSGAVEASRESDSVLIVEEKYKSRISDLNRMAEMMTYENTTVIGAVLL